MIAGSTLVLVSSYFLAMTYLFSSAIKPCVGKPRTPSHIMCQEFGYGCTPQVPKAKEPSTDVYVRLTCGSIFPLATEREWSISQLEVALAMTSTGLIYDSADSPGGRLYTTELIT